MVTLIIILTIRELNCFFYNINEYAVKRKIEIDQKLLENLLNVINNMLDINIKEVSDSVYEVMKNTENNCKCSGMIFYIER